MKEKFIVKSILFGVIISSLQTISFGEDIPALLTPASDAPNKILSGEALDKIAPLREEDQESKLKAQDATSGDDYISTPISEEKTEEEDQAQVFVSGAKKVHQMMPAVHFLHKPMNSDLGAIAWTNYIRVIDPNRVYFTQDDIEEFEKDKKKQIEFLKSGDFNYAINVLDVYRSRVEEYKEFAEKYFEGKSAEEFLASVENFSTDRSFLWQRKNADWAVDKTAQEQIWKERLQNQYLAAVINEVLKQEEKAAKKAQKNESEEVTSVPTEITDVVTNEFHEKTVENILKGVRRYNDVVKDLDVDTYKSYFINSFTEAYDPHSSYLSPEKKEDFDIDMGLSLQGIGATLSIEDGMPKVVSIIPGGPADRDISENHLIPGDKIIAVAQGDEEFVDVTHWPLNKSIRLIRGPKDTIVRLKVIPSTDASGTTTKIVTLVRDEIKLEEQAVSHVVKELVDENGKTRKFGYINLPSFYSNAGIDDVDSDSVCSATIDMEKSIEALKKEGVEGIVLDLRGNGGGSLPEAISIAGLFIKRGPVVLVKERYRVHTLRDDSSDVAYTGPLVVLIDKLSASASEIVAGALQDYGRAIIIGDRQTHGKGSVQTIMSLGETTGALKATTASFYRINGSSTQIKGVESDIVLSSVFDYISDLGEDKLPNAIPHSKVKSASFTKVADLKQTIDFAKQKSEKRLAEDSRWGKHKVMLDCVNTNNTNLFVTLNYEIRLNEERASRKATEDVVEEGSDEALFISMSNGDSTVDENEETSDAVKEALEEAAKTPEQRQKEREEKKRKMRDRDIVLTESYNILLDIINSGLPTGELSSKTQTDLDFILNFFTPSKAE